MYFYNHYKIKCFKYSLQNPHSNVNTQLQHPIATAQQRTQRPRTHLQPPSNTEYALKPLKTTQNV